MTKLELDEGKIVYEFDPEAVWEKDGKTYKFMSLKKISTYKENKKFQNLTIKPEHFNDFKDFILRCFEEDSGDKPPF